jgi:tRNA (cytidine/uridine-2'-O-)-methyltransferase
MNDNNNFNVVLVAPEIPQNTGNIGRLCVSTNTRLHLIKPLGFSLEDKYLKRAGMDYWPQLKPDIYDCWDDFLAANPNAELLFFSTKTEKIFWDCQYPQNAYLVFGNEGHGLPLDFYEKYRDRMYTIPMCGDFCRSFNLANSVAISLFEGLRQQNVRT